MGINFLLLLICLRVISNLSLLTSGVITVGNSWLYNISISNFLINFLMLLNAFFCCLVYLNSFSFLSSLVNG
jgi:hypothetical protein